jgi:hypothetical protein
LKDENDELISNWKISDPTRRIQGENHYLFWDPEPQSCHRHGIPWNLPSSFFISRALKTSHSPHLGMI